MTMLSINGVKHNIEMESETPLLWVLRDYIGLVGTKFGCGMGQCGACTVHLDGAAVRSCSTTIAEAAGAEVTTIEHLSQDVVGAALQKAWLEEDVIQCGYCQAGQLMSAATLLTDNATPSEEDINDHMAGNICRCGTYTRIRAAIKRAAAVLRDAKSTGGLS